MIGTYAVGTVAGTLALDPTHIYTIIHKGVDATFAVDGNQINLAVGAAVPDGGVGADKYFLSDGEAVDIGPGQSLLTFQCAAGAPLFGLSSIVALPEEQTQRAGL